MSFKLAEVVERCILMTLTPATWSSTLPVVPAPPPTSRSNGVAAGSPSTPPASHLRWPGSRSWARAIPTTCSPTSPKASGRKPRSPAPRRSSRPRRQHPPGLRLERVPHITLKSIANNAEIDVIWDKCAARRSNRCASRSNAPLGEDVGGMGDSARGRARTGLARRSEGRTPHWWEARIARQKEIDASIAAKAESEYLYDKPYADKSHASASPARSRSRASRPTASLAVDWNDELIDRSAATAERRRRRDRRRATSPDDPGKPQDRRRAAGRTRRTGSPSPASPAGPALICAEGRYLEGETQRRAGIFIGPEFGTVSRPDLVAAAREAGDAGFDVLIACAFNYDAHSAEFDKLGRVPVLKARMNPDLHMADDLKATGAGNLFVVFGEPDIEIEDAARATRSASSDNGVDVFKPQTGEVCREGTDGIALWMHRHRLQRGELLRPPRLFPRRQRPLQGAEDHAQGRDRRGSVGELLNSDMSRPFPKPARGRIAVKVINHLGDEVMKVFAVTP